MELFTAIEDGQAIIQKPKGVCKQVKLYHRDGKVYIGEAGGFVQVRRKWGNDPHGTAHPDIKVLDLEGKGITFKDNEAPAYKPQGWGTK